MAGEDAYLKETGDRLLVITDGCRYDMHEPDEQSLKAWVVGDHLDNAFGDSIVSDAIKGHYQELVVCLERYMPRTMVPTGGYVAEQLNLATLLALARIGALSLQQELGE
jgi:hypothetical protein